MYALGFDIGGTKSAVLLARTDGKSVEFLNRAEIPTRGSWQSILDKLIALAEGFLTERGILDRKEVCCGISCGGPLNPDSGVILSPPNLPGWDEVPVCDYITSRLNAPAALMNDADACALAEWRFGSGRGSQNMVFLTFGTGLGAGLILGGRLYTGTNGMAGEVGHIRLARQGSVGYHKAGSFEGFCSGAGIAKQAADYVLAMRKRGYNPAFAEGKEADSITAKDVAMAADKGDADALKIFERVGKNFGRGLSVLIDILNPEVIVAGGVFMRSGHLMIPAMEKELQREALARSLSVCRVLPAALGERIGDYGAVSAALRSMEEK